MDKYFDYIMESASGIIYFTCTAAFISVIISCSFTQHIYWNRAVIVAFIWIFPTILHIKRFKKYKEKRKNECEC